MNRRGFIGSILALSAAPAIVRADSLMCLWVPPPQTVMKVGASAILPHGAALSLGDVITISGFGRKQFVVNAVNLSGVYSLVQLDGTKTSLRMAA